MMKEQFPRLFDEKYCERWWSEGYGKEVKLVKPVLEIEGFDIGFNRASRPNGSDGANWELVTKRDKRL